MCSGLHCDTNLSILNLVIVKEGEKDIPGPTDTTVPHRPKELAESTDFSVSKEGDVRHYVVRKPPKQRG